MITNKEKEKFLLANGWKKYGRSSYVKTEWLNEPEKLNLPAHLCPHWYHTESLDTAYQNTLNEIKEYNDKKNDLLNNGWEIKDDGFVKINWDNKSKPLTISEAHLMLESDIIDEKREEKRIKLFGK